MSNTNHDVAHIWAQQGNRTSLKSNNGNFWFQDRTLYSYNTPIAEFQRREDDTPLIFNGRPVVHVTSETFSVTTSGKHMGALHRALGYGDNSIATQLRVPVVRPYHYNGRGEGATSFADMHAKNLAALEAQAVTAATKGKRARVHKSWHERDVATAVETARLYCEAWGLDAPAWASSADLGALVAAYEARKAEERQQERERQERQRAHDLAAFEEWQQGKRDRAPYSFSTGPNGSAYIRRSPDGENLETSQGASVPWRHALRVFRFVKLCRENGTAWARNGQTVRVGHYQLDRVDADGSFKAGCHFIAWAQIEALAVAQGVFNVEPSSEAVTSSH